MATCKTLDSPHGLIFVYSDPGCNVSEEEFSDWYDNEHIPPRLCVPGVLSASRYKAADSQSPSWLALYDITSPDVTQSPEYKGLIPNASAREKRIMAELGSINRRVYEHVLSYIHPTTSLSSLPGRYVFAVHMKVTLQGEEEFNRWYNEEHMVMLSRMPGWLCGRRYRLVESVSRGVKREPAEDEKPQAEYLAIHELEMQGFMGLPEFRAAIQTPWRERVMKTVTYSELRRIDTSSVIYPDYVTCRI
ncbi:hypothetical protein LshimejAT787_0904000 [Lyophyllum shimeji]|uniref:Uncharacterized protein n=1 Tax=Lyophyllum shimeji TaxID=47721 RepID=A0A9P3URC6_LYOSH|nr:hypothetical protein LshimejAT787_0904000 [Lyophyllum shimeji]